MSAGTIMHRNHLSLKTWFTAVHIVTSHSNGISALQPQAQLGLGSYKSAWLLLHKLRRAMVAPDRGLLADLVEIDEMTFPLRIKDVPPRRRAAPRRRGGSLARGRAAAYPAGADRRLLQFLCWIHTERLVHKMPVCNDVQQQEVCVDRDRILMTYRLLVAYCPRPTSAREAVRDHEQGIAAAAPAHVLEEGAHRLRVLLGTGHRMRQDLGAVAVNP